MAVAKNNILVAPSTDKKTLDQLDSVQIEAGLFYAKASKTINGVTADRWTVICISNETKLNLHCYTQIWIPSVSGSTNIAANRVFIRTAAEESTSYTSFTTVL